MNPVSALYKKLFIHRYDDEGYKYFFTAKDFPSLHADEFAIYSPQHNRLEAVFYYYDDFDENSLVVFCHGIGEGHLQYTKEIEELCKAGFKVLAFDITGCAASSGKDIRGLSQSLCDLECVIEYVKHTKDFKNKRLFLVGHSWGGFAVANVLGFKDGIEKAVVISGFDSVQRLVSSFFVGPLKPAASLVMSHERKTNPVFADSTAVDALNETDAKVLVIHSRDDKTVKFSDGAGLWQKLVKNPNVRYLETDGRNHGPYYTKEASDYMLSVFDRFEKLCKSGKIKTLRQKQEFFKDVDWEKMTKHDPEVFNRIVSFLKEEKRD